MGISERTTQMEKIAYFEDQLLRNARSMVETLERLSSSGPALMGDYDRLEAIPELLRLEANRREILFRYALKRHERVHEKARLPDSPELREPAMALYAIIQHILDEAAAVINGIAE